MIHYVDVRNFLGPYLLAQSLIPPSVYLDHCAVSHLAQNPQLAKRLFDAIKSRNGTLVISLINRFEFSGFPNPITAVDQANQADAGFVQAWPNIFFIEVSAPIVIEREVAAFLGRLSPRFTTPCESTMHIDDMEKHTHNTSSGMQRAEGIYRDGARWRDEYGQVIASLKREGLDTIRNFRREKIADNPDFKKKIRGLLREFGPKGTRTGLTSTELFCMLLTVGYDKSKPEPDENDMIDFLHACVPSVYCDYVALDRGWRSLVNQIGVQLTNNKVGMPLAKSIAPTNEGMDKLIREILARPVTVITPAHVWKMQCALQARIGISDGTPGVIFNTVGVPHDGATP